MNDLRPGSLRVWVLASRPATLLVGIVPVLVGAAIARASGALRIGPAIAALLGAAWIQIGTNLANDVFDHARGADAARVGSVRVTQAGLLTPAQVRRGMIASFALAFAAGVYLTWSAGWPIVVIGLVSIASGLAYTGGPYPLAYNGLGDVFVFVFFGLVAVCGTTFVASGSVPLEAVIAGVPLGAISTAVLVVNNVRDFRTDPLAGKWTLVARYGRGFGVAEYAGLLALAFASPVALVATGRASSWVLLPLLTAPYAASLVRTLRRHHEGPVLDRCLASTARLLLAFGALLAIGISL